MQKIISLLLALSLCLTGCALSPRAQAAPASIEFPSSALAGKPENTDVSVLLTSGGAKIQGSGVSVSGNEITFSLPGSYLLSGEWTGTLIVDVEAEKKVTLCLNGVSLIGDKSAAIWVKSEPKNVTLHLCEGSVNLIQDAAEYALEETEDDFPDAAIYSQDDLRFTGNGALYVSSQTHKGIHSKDDIEIQGGQIFVKSFDDGIHGKDSVSITGGSVTVEAGADGIRSTNGEKEGKGFVLISGSEVAVTSGQDGIQAETDLTVSGGSVLIVCGGGSANASTEKTAESWGNRGGNQRDAASGKNIRNRNNARGDAHDANTPNGNTPGENAPDANTPNGSVPGGYFPYGDIPTGFMPGNFDATSLESEDSEPSAKALKAGKSLTVSGGNLVLDSSDDAIHSNGSVLISGGEILLSSGDDGIHADETLEISGGSTEIEKSYEGIESAVITLSGGSVRLTASDDGVNAAGGADQSSVNGRPGQNWARGMMSNGIGEIHITGGYLVVQADGDGLDSNGSIDMTGGTVLVYGPVSSGNGALDYDRSFTFSGGSLLAVGCSGMAQSVTAEGNAAVIAFTCRQNADALMTVLDAEGAEILAFVSPKAYSCVVYASSSLISGETYSVYTGGTHDGEPADGIYPLGQTVGGELLGELSAR